jgi:hypothetical protein
MPPAIASAGCAVLILGLFWLDGDRQAHTSTGLWIPMIWLSLASSRSVEMWLQIGTPMSSADQAAEPGEVMVQQLIPGDGAILYSSSTKP